MNWRSSRARISWRCSSICASARKGIHWKHCCIDKGPGKAGKKSRVGGWEHNVSSSVTAPAPSRSLLSCGRCMRGRNFEVWECGRPNRLRAMMRFSPGSHQLRSIGVEECSCRQGRLDGLDTPFDSGGVKEIAGTTNSHAVSCPVNSFLLDSGPPSSIYPRTVDHNLAVE